MTYLANIGRYGLMLLEMFKKPTKWGVMKKLILKEIDELIFSSLGIIIFISFFIGGVVTIQTALNLTSPFLPKSLIGFATRQSVILEFAPTFTSIIMVGKVGSYITSSIGSMRVTEQIDALEVMGVNSVNYLIFPKFIAMLFYPFAIAISMYVGILGGWSAAVFGGLCSYLRIYRGRTTRLGYISHSIRLYQKPCFCNCHRYTPGLSRLLFKRWSLRGR
jgi:phospholipid/cholesterol/gamma-HCH transport system permease protein